MGEQNIILEKATNTQIGTFFFDSYPHDDFTEQRQGTVYTDYGDGKGWVLEPETTCEYVTIPHEVSWLDGRNYPDEIAFVEGYPGDYYEIGKLVNGTWVAAGVIVEMSCIQEDRAAGRPLEYQIQWNKAFQHLPACFIRFSPATVKPPTLFIVEHDN